MKFAKGLVLCLALIQFYSCERLVGQKKKAETDTTRTKSPWFLGKDAEEESLIAGGCREQGGG